MESIKIDAHVLDQPTLRISAHKLGTTFVAESFLLVVHDHVMCGIK
jgi:hypothetical protein